MSIFLFDCNLIFTSSVQELTIVESYVLCGIWPQRGKKKFCHSEVFNWLFQIQVAVLTSEKHKVQEHLRTSSEQHQRTLSAYQQKIANLQEECRAAQVL